MTYPQVTTSSSRAGGYPWATFRIEWRPTYGLHSRQDLTEALDTLADAGVRAWWYSVAAKGSYPLFPSVSLPHRDDHDADVLRWLTEEAHARGIAIFSWEYLNKAPMLIAEHEDWKYRWLEGGEGVTPPHLFTCYNSPYGEMLKHYCVEVIDLGFDGIWFDGATVHSVGMPYRRAGCRCAFCNAKHREQTGRDIPERYDLDDPAVRAYVEWRYRDFMAYWQTLTDHLAARHPKAVLAFNHFNRLTSGCESGAPLRRTPINAMIAGETNGRRNHLLLHHKILRAINDNFPTEVWDAALDGTRFTYPNRPNPDPTTLIFHCQASAAVGGFGSFGIGDHPREYRETLRAMSDALDPIAPYVGGTPITCLGLVVSGATKDFAYRGTPYGYWKSVHGMHNLLDALHLPSEVVLDDALEDLKELRRHAVLVLVDTQCLSDRAAATLADYVRGGGWLYTFGEVGTRTEMGETRPCGVLDDLLGIVRRHEEPIAPIVDPACEALRGGGLPERYMVSGPARLVEVTDAEVWATATYATGEANAKKSRAYGPQGLIQPQVEHRTGALVVSRTHGAGRCIHVAANVGPGYAYNPNRRTREFVRRLLARRVEAPFTTDAPANVVVTAWRQQGRVAIHLLNVPDVMRRFAGDQPDMSDTSWPEDFTPTAPITVRLPGSWRSASLPTPAPRLTVEAGPEAITCTIDRLDQHAVIVVE